MNHHRKHHVHQHHHSYSIQHESSSVKIFKSTFIKEMHVFKKKVQCLVSGDSTYSNSLKETLIQSGAAVGTVAAGTVVASLGAVSILSAAATGGLSLAIAIAGIVFAVAYNFYLDKKKKKQLKQALLILENKKFDKNVNLLADILAHLHQHQLVLCTDADASCIATNCFEAITHEMRENKFLRQKDLLSPGYLEGIIFNHAKQISDVRLHMTGAASAKTHSRALIKKPALYCEEEKAVYSCPKAKPKKYGVLFFQSKEELDEYRMAVEKAKLHKKGWHYKKLHPSETANLMKLSFCKGHANDCKIAQQKTSESLEKNHDAIAQLKV